MTFDETYQIPIMKKDAGDDEAEESSSGSTSSDEEKNFSTSGRMKELGKFSNLHWKEFLDEPDSSSKRSE